MNRLRNTESKQIRTGTGMTPIPAGTGSYGSTSTNTAQVALQVLNEKVRFLQQLHPEPLINP
jgi:hypothetical protein